MAKRERVAEAGQADELPLVSIITINYNQAEMTRQFLDSCRGLTYPNYEIIVVDNASVPAFDTVVDQRDYSRLRLIRTERNTGFTGGNNAGIAEARGDYLFIVNNDTELTPTLIDTLLRPFAANDRVGVTCPKIRFFDAPTIVQYAGYNPMNMYTGTATPVGLNQPDGSRYNQPGVTPFAHGCAMMVSRAVVDKVGRFADRFFLYYEELDWSQRIRDAGFLIYYQPSAVILHKESASIGRRNPLKTYYLTRNRILFMRRHCSPFQLAVFYLFFISCVLPKHIISYAATGRFQHVRAFVRGILWNLTSPSMSPV